MNIAMIGAGNIGGTLGKKWAAAGHEVAFGVRDPASEKIQSLLAETQGKASAHEIGDALAFGEVVLLATPWRVVPDIAKTYGSKLVGKIVIDATNNFGGPVINNIPAIISVAPTARIYRAFNSLGWEVCARPLFGDQTTDLFYCGADGEDRKVVEILIEEIGLRPIWVGGLDRVALVDNLGALWVTLAYRQGLGRRLGIKALTE
jgi:predicted dinucleotide-binding enzyme